MIGCFYHEVEHGVFGAHDTHAFKLAARVYTCYKWLIIGLLLVAELHVEES